MGFKREPKFVSRYKRKVRIRKKFLVLQNAQDFRFSEVQDIFMLR